MFFWVCSLYCQMVGRLIWLLCRVVNGLVEVDLILQDEVSGDVVLEASEVTSCLHGCLLVLLKW